MEELKYPIGPFKKPETITKDMLQNYISIIEAFPEKIKSETASLSNEQLDTPYRPGGWTVRQVVNHCADSHMNAIIRIKLALTEQTPTILPYRQDLWAELADSKNLPTDASLKIIEGVHHRWVNLLRSLNDKQWGMAYIHPEKGREITMQEAAASYAWHCKHHLAHITSLKKRKGWK